MTTIKVPQDVQKERVLRLVAKLTQSANLVDNAPPDPNMRYLQSRARADMAELRHSIRDPLRAAPYVAPLFGKDEPFGDNDIWFYRIAALFATHRKHEKKQSLGRAFRVLKTKQSGKDKPDSTDKANSTDNRFLQIISADEKRLPDLLRPAVALLAAHDVPLDWEYLLMDILHWNARDKPRQHRLARDFYSDFNTQDDDATKGLTDAPEN